MGPTVEAIYPNNPLLVCILSAFDKLLIVPKMPFNVLYEM